MTNMTSVLTNTSKNGTLPSVIFYPSSEIGFRFVSMTCKVNMSVFACSITVNRAQGHCESHLKIQEDPITQRVEEERKNTDRNNSY